MKVALYFESEKLIQTSGIGRAFYHQKMALESAGVEYTTDTEGLRVHLKLNLREKKVLK